MDTISHYVTGYFLYLHQWPRKKQENTYSSKVRCLMDHSCALLLPDVVIHHHLERAFLRTLKWNKDEGN